MDHVQLGTSIVIRSGLITSLRVAGPSPSKNGSCDLSPIRACNYLSAFVRTAKDASGEDADALPQDNDRADIDHEVEGHGGAAVLRYLHLLTESLAAAYHVSARLRGIVGAERWTDWRRSLKLSLIELDVACDTFEQVASTREEIVAYLAHSVDQRKVQDDVRESAKGWLGLHCKYDLSRQRHFTVHAEAGLMALVSAMHETEGKVRKLIQGDSALKELEKVKAICAVA